MKRIGFGTYTLVNGVEIENGMMVPDDVGGAPVPEPGDEISHSFAPGQRVRIVSEFLSEDSSENTGTVVRCLADATGLVLVEIDTDAGTQRLIPSIHVEAAA